MTETYTETLRRLAMSLLSGVQRLEDAGAEASDNAFSDAQQLIVEADAAVWQLVDHIEDGRPDQ